MIWKKNLKAFLSCTENADVSRGCSTAALVIQPHLKNNDQTACSKLKTTIFKVEVLGSERHSNIRRHEHFCSELFITSSVSCEDDPLVL